MIEKSMRSTDNMDRMVYEAMNIETPITVKQDEESETDPKPRKLKTKSGKIKKSSQSSSQKGIIEESL